MRMMQARTTAVLSKKEDKEIKIKGNIAVVGEDDTYDYKYSVAALSLPVIRIQTAGAHSIAALSFPVIRIQTAGAHSIAALSFPVIRFQTAGAHSKATRLHRFIADYIHNITRAGKCVAIVTESIFILFSQVEIRDSAYTLNNCHTIKFNIHFSPDYDTMYINILQ